MTTMPQPPRAQVLRGLLNALPPEAPVVIAARETLTAGALVQCVEARARAVSNLPRGVPLAAPASIDGVVDVLAHLVADRLPILVNPRWPAALRDGVLTRVRVAPQTHPHVDVLFFTSGSSARPKAVAHTLTSLLASARLANAAVPFTAGDRWLQSLPLCHVGGLGILLRALVAGATVAVPEVGQALGSALVQLAPTHLSVVAVQLLRMVDAVAAPPPSLREIMVGGGPTAPALLGRAVAAGFPIRQTWGMTETAAQVCTSPRNSPATCGLPAADTVRLAADGEIFVKTPGLFAGYLDDNGLLQCPFDPDGFFATGDRGALTPEGLVVLGRKDAMFISGGENVSPEEVAALLGDATTQVTVVPVADPVWGQRAFAFFESTLSPEAALATLQARARDIAPHMRPVRSAPLPAGDGLKSSRTQLIATAQRLCDDATRIPSTRIP